MIRDGASGTWSGRSSSAAGAAGAPARRAPPPKAATTSNAPPHRTFIGSPSLPRGPTAGGVVRRRTTREPIAKRVGFLSQPPFLEDRQRHRAHATLAGAGREALLLQPRFELVRLRVGRDGPLQQVEFDRQSDRVGRRVALAALASPLRRLERREQLAAHRGRARGGYRRHDLHILHRPPPSSTTVASNAYPGRSGRRYPRSRATTRQAPHTGQYPSLQLVGISGARPRAQAGSSGTAAICPTTRTACASAPAAAASASLRASSWHTAAASRASPSMSRLPPFTCG